MNARPAARVILSLFITCGAGGCSEDNSAGTRPEPDASPASTTPPDGGALIAMSCDDSASGTEPCTACTRQGWVRGISESASCEFLGIPYAEPPVGARRWAAPEPAAGWPGVRDTVEFGAACNQVNDLSASPVKSEDCLFLNVWAPSETPSAALPVMVFIHGGGYTAGATNPHRGLDLSEAGPVVVVSMNYRLGPLGFFAHPELDAERADAPSGSDGIRDQQLALEWVRDNIASFHGDPENVTLFGESAGSSSVGVHHVSPGSSGLVRRFLMESGVTISGVANGIEPMTREVMYDQTRQMAEALCPGAADVLGCLRAVPADQIMPFRPATTAREGILWAPVIEGAGGVLPEHPDALIASGSFNDGEVLVGTNKNEYGLFILGGGAVTTVAAFTADVEQRFGARASEVLALYAPATDADTRQAQIDLMTDIMFRCATRSFARALEAAGGEVYLYSFEQGNAWHADELGYVFGPGFYGLDLANAMAGLSETIQAYWTSFAAAGDPNAQGLPAWPTYDAVGDQHLVLAEPPTTGSGLREQHCDFWDGYLAATR